MSDAQGLVCVCVCAHVWMDGCGYEDVHGHMHVGVCVYV